MELEFDKGNPQEPKGHAIIYFRARLEPDKLFAAYVIILPFLIDFSKYVPPFLASHMTSSSLNELSAFSLPPVPEEVESHGGLIHLANMRLDDLVCGGSVSPNDIPEMMQATSDAVQEYSRLWTEYFGSSTKSPSESGGSGLGVEEVLYTFMNERDKLEELSKLLGKLRFAIEGNDLEQSTEAHQQISLVGQYLPENYDVPSLLIAAADVSGRGSSLAQLYLERCYKLLDGDEVGAIELENKIKALETSG